MKLFVEHLTVIDAAYLHAEHGIVGESWIVDAVLHGDLDPQSMVMDFGRVKKQLKTAIDDTIDHTLIVPAQSPALSERHRGEMLELRFAFGDGEMLEHGSPDAAVTFIDAPAITTEALRHWLEAMLMRIVPANVSRVEIHLHHEADDQPFYHYAHGLKKHDGNCQRIAHGHRSRLMIWEEHHRAPMLERRWAEDWNRRYIASRADVAGEDGANTRFAYESAQGRFTLSYPTARCYFLDTDTTVECIAQHIADTLRMHHPARSYRVRAYEGVHKGAIGEA